MNLEGNQEMLVVDEIVVVVVVVPMKIVPIGDEIQLAYSDSRSKGKEGIQEEGRKVGPVSKTLYYYYCYS